MIEIKNEEEVKDEEFNPTYEDDEQNEESGHQEEETLAPIVQMNQPEKKEDEEEEKPKTISQMFGGIATFIEVGLKEMAKENEELMAMLDNDSKSLDECIKYVIGEFQQKVFRGNGMSVSVSDDENGADVLELAMHYYETPDCKPRGMFTPPAPPKVKETKTKETKPKEKKTEKKKIDKKGKAEKKSAPTLSKEELDAASAKAFGASSQPEVFKGLKKGSKAYNKAVMNSLQGDLFGSMFNDENDENK